MRVQRHEFGQERRDMAQAEAHRHGQPHQPARGVALGARLCLGGLAIGKDAPRAFKHAAPAFGQRQTAAGPVQQGHAEPRLQTAQRLGYRGLGQPQRLCGGGERAGIDDFGKDRPGFEVGKRH
jgi:hypothetical protein